VRFPKLTRTLIANAKGKSVEIVWPEGEPEVGKVYWVQSAEEKPREPSESHADVMAAMFRRQGKPRPPKKKKKKRRRRSRFRRPNKGDPRIEVLSKRRLSWAGGEGRVIHCWLVIVERYEEPAAVHYLQTKAYVPAGPDPLTGEHEKAETEPEQIPETDIEHHHYRMEEHDSLRLEHKASVDRAELARSEQHLHRKQRRGKRSPLAEAAAQRARKRAAENDDRSDCKDAA